MPAKGSAEWNGDLRTGTGTFTAGDTISGGYTFKSRFEDGPGSNPEQLIAAAHAACFSMALSLYLGEAGMTAESIETTATVSLDPDPAGGFAVTSSHLQTTVKIPNADKAAFQKAVEATKIGCPISKLLKATITMDARLI